LSGGLLNSAQHRIHARIGVPAYFENSGDDITDFNFGKPNKNKDGDVVFKDGVVSTQACSRPF
jgi:hypothetical protein